MTQSDGVHMGCPHYQDFTRNCIQYFPRVLSHTSFTTCESEKYFDCFAYIALQSKFRCKYQNSCIEDLTVNIPYLTKFFVESDSTVQIFRDAMVKYCSSEQNHVNCACFKSLEQGIHPPVELLPDGSKFRLRDIVFKKKVVLE